ncbi:MAG TPA: hypothetical protein VN203_02415, partial [Candidatus Acidoferrum sp.]|nr:hypothetical protein [Candidatus Acidoferrum sp.]
WIAGSLVLGFHLGVMLMGLLGISHSRSDHGLASPRVENKTMLKRGRSVAPAASTFRTRGFAGTFSGEELIPANDASEEFDARTGGVC